MFNRAVITDEISQDFDLAVGMAKQFGLDQLEIRTVWETRIDAMSSEQLRRIKETAERHGLSVAGLAAPFLKCELGDDDEYAEHLHILRQCIAAGRALGTSLIRGFTFWKRDGLDDHYQQILDSYAEPARIAREEGVTIGIENEGSCYVGTGAELARFLGDLNEPSVRAVWDPANACWDGGETTWADGYPLVKPYIAHVHVKDKRQVTPTRVRKPSSSATEKWTSPASYRRSRTTATRAVSRSKRTTGSRTGWPRISPACRAAAPSRKAAKRVRAGAWWPGTR